MAEDVQQEIYIPSEDFVRRFFSAYRRKPEYSNHPSLQDVAIEEKMEDARKGLSEFFYFAIADIGYWSSALGKKVRISENGVFDPDAKKVFFR